MIVCFLYDKGVLFFSVMKSISLSLLVLASPVLVTSAPAAAVVRVLPTAQGPLLLVSNAVPGLATVERADGTVPTTWYTVGPAEIDATGQGRYLDAPASRERQRFYRAVQGLPVPTTLRITGVEDQPFAFTLGTMPGTVASRVITGLPATGLLRQLDGTPILSVPTVVTSPSHRCRYDPPPDVGGAPLASFSYSVSNVSGMSAPLAVAVNIQPINDPPTITGPRLIIATPPPGHVLPSTIVRDLQVGDADAGDGILAVDLLPNRGTVGGVHLVDASGLASYEVLADGAIHFTGTLTQINTALGRGFVYYAWVMEASDLLFVVVNDNGSSGAATSPGETAFAAIPVEVRPD